MIKKLILCSCALAMSFAFCACNEDSPKTDMGNVKPDEPIVIDRTKIACGADVSWLTKMESEGLKFTSKSGKEMECMQLLRDSCGVNAIRLRVWVNPADGWNNIDDVIIKARRANKLGMRLMIDFHFSDTWADPGHQETPAAWASMSLEELKVAVGEHVTECMQKLNALGIEPEWVQIGNETRNGMLYPLGNFDQGANFSQLVNAGGSAVKAVFPEAKVIVHIDSGDKWDLYTRAYGNLITYGGNYDMIGISLYPEVASWKTDVNNAIANIAKAYAQYGKETMICEIGMTYSKGDDCKEMLTKILTKAKEKDSHIKGVFYWEPQAPSGYNEYQKGAFEDGHPTNALDAFKMMQE